MWEGEGRLRGFRSEPTKTKKDHQLSSGEFSSHPNEGSQKALIVKIHNVSVLRQKELLQRPRTTVVRHILQHAVRYPRK